MNKRLAKRVALLVCGALVLGIACSFALAIGHGCCRQRAACPVCHQLDIVRALLKQLALALGLLPLLLRARDRAPAAAPWLAAPPRCASPVKLGVRMNN